MYGQILRIDLTREKITREPIEKEIIRRFIGGEGINCWLLWEHFLKVDPRIDPLGPDNVLVAGLGPLGGTPYGRGSKMKWTYKSPIYNMYGDTVVGGGFGANLRWSGYDHVVITGRAKHPVYIWIKDDLVEIRNADSIWSKDAQETDDLIKEELGDDRAEIACVGTAPVNGVTFGSITVSRHRSAGRTGGGTVMASKNLKAMVAHGTKGIRVHDPKGFMAAMERLATVLNQSFQATENLKKYGTLKDMIWHQELGDNPFHNHQGVLPDDRFQMLHPRWYWEHMAERGVSCSPGCATGCGTWHTVKGNETPLAKDYIGESSKNPEYVTVSGFGGLCDVADVPAIAHFSEMCNRLGMDVVEMANICSFLMEIWERGIINRQDSMDWFGEPLPIEWGNHKTVEKIIESAALQNDKLGPIIKDGVYQAALRIEKLKGTPVLKYVVYGKGGSPHVEEIRHSPGWAMLFTTSPRGADHCKGGAACLDKSNNPDLANFYFGQPELCRPLTITLRGANAAQAETYNRALNTLGICQLQVQSNPALYSLEMFSEALNAMTGLGVTAQELGTVGERIANLEKAFNSRLGYRREDDRLCERWMKEPIASGFGKGFKAENYLEKLKDEYYEWRGWDKKTSLQPRKKLEELDMADIADILEREGALAKP